MSERAWKYGDVVRVDPTTQPQVPQPDDRRWMVITTRRDVQKWALIYLVPANGGTCEVSHWASMYGFCLAGKP